MAIKAAEKTPVTMNPVTRPGRFAEEVRGSSMCPDVGVGGVGNGESSASTRIDLKDASPDTGIVEWGGPSGGHDPTDRNGVGGGDEQVVVGCRWISARGGRALNLPNRLEAAPRQSHRAPVVSKRKAKPHVALKERGRTVPLELSLIGSSDGVPVELTGRGNFDTGGGRLTLDVGIARSLLLFDPALVSISLLDVLALAALGMRQAPEPDWDSPLYVRSRTDLYDESGREAGGWRGVVALMRARCGCVRLDGQVLDCSLRIEPGERVVAADAPRRIIATRVEPEGKLFAKAWEARTGRGNSYRGLTTTVHESYAWLDCMPTAEEIEQEEIQFRRTVSASGETVSVGCRYRRWRNCRAR